MPAAAQNVPLVQHPWDPLCNYNIFRFREDGRVPCLAIGKDASHNYKDSIGEVTGLYFQKVDTGIVRPVLDSNVFAKINWPNAPSRIVRRPKDPNLLLTHHVAPTHTWHQFAEYMVHIRNTLITQMTPPGGPPPRTLYEALNENVWIGGNNNVRSLTMVDSQLKTVKQILGQNWIDIKAFYLFVECLVDGFSCCAERVSVLLDYLLDFEIYGEKGIILSPSETSQNKTIRNGVLHCLVYGYSLGQLLSVENEEQERQRNRGRNRHQGLYGGDRGRLRQRVLLPRQLGLRDRSRSRSRSPSPANDLNLDVINVANPGGIVPTVQEMLNNPDDYELKHFRHHSYYEPHKPDMILYESSNDRMKAKVVVEVCSYKKFPRATFASHLAQSTEQCVLQCLSGISFNQNEISGLVVVPDGMKLIKVKKQTHPNQNVSFLIQETDLIAWHESFMLYQLLQDLNMTMT